MTPAARRLPALLPLLSAQFADGLGGKLSSALLALYAARVAGLSGFSAYTAAGLVGCVAAGVVVPALQRRLDGRRILAGSVAVLASSRLVAYSAVAFSRPLWWLFVSTFLGAIAGTTMVSAAKALVPADRDATRNLAWLGIVSAIGGTVGAAVAGVLSAWGPVTALVAVGVPAATLSLVPMLRLARTAERGVAVPTTPAPTGELLRAVWQPASLGAAVVLFTSALPLLRDGLVSELYSSSWLGAVAAAALVGNVLAANVVRRLAARSRTGRHDRVIWPLVGAAGLVGWAVADRGLVFLLLAQVLAGFAGQAGAALVEGRILAIAGPQRALSALTAAGALGSLSSTVAVTVAPWLLTRTGLDGLVAVTASPLLVLATVAYFRSFNPFQARFTRWSATSLRDGSPTSSHHSPTSATIPTSARA